MIIDLWASDTPTIQVKCKSREIFATVVRERIRQFKALRLIELWKSKGRETDRKRPRQRERERNSW